MNKVSESIWSNDNVIIPMAEVSHIEKHKDDRDSKNRITVIFKHSRITTDNPYYDPAVYLCNEDGKSFVSSWCRYRGELEGVDFESELQSIKVLRKMQGG